MNLLSTGASLVSWGLEKVSSTRRTDFASARKKTSSWRIPTITESRYSRRPESSNISSGYQASYTTAFLAVGSNHFEPSCGELQNCVFCASAPGREEGQLWYPRKVAVMRQTGKYVVCDRGNERSRMQIFTKNGHFIKKIAIRYIDIVAGLAITNTGT